MQICRSSTNWMKICENNKIEKVLDFKVRQKFDF